jgi:hypothetical protein
MRPRPWWAAPIALIVPVAAITGCESTQDRSAQLRKKANTVLSQRTQTLVTRVNPYVKVLRAVTLHDDNGSAAVVELRNTSRRALVNVPVAIDVRGAGGTSVFRNDAAGIEPSLVGPAYVPPTSQFAWVNDQVSATGVPRSVVARVGVGHGAPPRSVPSIQVGAPHLETDPTSGISAVGTVTDRSPIVQRKLVLYCIATRGGRIVAAGRGGIERLRPNKRTRYTIFFIGNPKGAKLTVAAPPTTFA